MRRITVILSLFLTVLCGCGLVPERPPLVFVAPVEGGPLPVALRLAVSTADALDKASIRATTDLSVETGYRLSGRIESDDEHLPGAFAVIIHWTVTDRQGHIIGGYTQPVQAPSWQWETGDSGLLGTVGEAAAEPLATLLGGL